MFTALVQTAKENPYTLLLGSSGSIIAIVAALFTVDGRYAHAADVEKVNNQTQQQIIDSTNILRRQMLEDKIFELDLKKSSNKNQALSPIDQALRDRYQQQVNDLLLQKKSREKTQQ